MELNQWLRKTGLRLFAGNTVGTVICWEYSWYGYLLGIQEVRLFAGNTGGTVICWEYSRCGYLLGTQLVWLFAGNTVGVVITIVLFIWLDWVSVTALGFSSYGAQAQ